MTVRELIELLDPEASVCILDTAGCIMPVNRIDQLPLIAYGRFEIKKIWLENAGVQLELKLHPVIGKSNRPLIPSQQSENAKKIDSPPIQR